MEIVIQVGLLAIGFLMLVKGADWFVEGAAKIADRFGIPQLVIGLTIVAMGTSAPEAAVSLTSALRGSAEITIGNVVGSNILNVLLILGLTGAITVVTVQKSTIRYEIPFVILISAFLAAVGLKDNVVSRLEGIILILLMVAYLLYLLMMAKKGNDCVEEVEGAEEGESNWKLVGLVIVGLGLIVFGSDVTVDAATELARIFGMSERLIGLTIVAFGTSLPELVTSVTAAIKGKPDLAVGNIVGSNIFNILFVVGVTAVITPVAYVASFTVDSIACIATVVLLLICVLRGRLERKGGIALLVGYVAYFIYLIK